MQRGTTVFERALRPSRLGCARTIVPQDAATEDLASDQVLRRLVELLRAATEQDGTSIHTINTYIPS
jgi:hypothetical protein